MSSIKSDIESEMRAGAHIGRVITGLAVMRETCRKVLLIVEGEDSQMLETDALGVSFRSITYKDRPLIAFAGLDEWWHSSGSPCIAFVTQGKQAVFAPAHALDAPDILQTVTRYVQTWHPDTETVYLSDLNGGLGGGDDALSITDGVLRARGEDLAIDQMTWAEVDLDGDGNSHLHVMLTDGRYRRVSLGDLGR